MARPTDYNPEILALAETYLTTGCAEDAVPSIEGLAEFINVSRSNIYLWASQEDKKEFSDILEKIREKQAKTLINKGLKSEFNSSIVKVMLSKHGYSEKTEIDHTTKGEALNSPHIAALTAQLNEIHRGGSITGDGGTTSSVGTETPNQN